MVKKPILPEGEIIMIFKIVTFVWPIAIHGDNNYRGRKQKGVDKKPCLSPYYRPSSLNV